MLDNVLYSLENCAKVEEQDGSFKFYASFPCASGNGTVGQYVFLPGNQLDDIELGVEPECFVGGLKPNADWKFDLLC